MVDVEPATADQDELNSILPLSIMPLSIQPLSILPLRMVSLSILSLSVLPLFILSGSIGEMLPVLGS